MSDTAQARNGGEGGGRGGRGGGDRGSGGRGGRGSGERGGADRGSRDNGRGRSTQKGARSTPSGGRARNAGSKAISVTHDSGIAEKVTDRGRYVMRDRRGRKIVDRVATRADRDRLRSLVE